ncbi:APC family permease [Tundrisphaera lichenicola]|uniref:APC family permease n=1 Tax=Tundrisphaera lichenicola TaxID=2029860 RepID=UPI003EB9B15B
MSKESSGGDAKLPRVLGPTEALCVVVGSVIGSGIFIVPAGVAKSVPFLGGIALVWVIGGLFSMAGALTLAELSTMLPSAGGPYVYLREAFGRLPAFLFGWTEFLVIRTGSIATLAAAFGLYFALLVPAPLGMHPLAWQTTAAVLATILLAAINVLGTKIGGQVQVIGTGLKIGAIVTMIVLPLALGKAEPALLTPAWPKSINYDIFRGIMAAMIGVLWTYDGWVNASALAEEIREPGRNIPRALIGGMLLLIVLYLGMTLLYHMVLPLSEIGAASFQKGSPRIVAADYFEHLLGPWGLRAMGLVVMASTFISLNGNALSGPRAYFAMARDGVFPKGLCTIHARYQTPANAIIAQAVWAVILMVSGTILLIVEPPTSGLTEPLIEAWRQLHEKPLYDFLYTYVIFGGTIFYGLAIGSVFVLRIRRPDLPRPYKTWGYPVTPLLYSAASLLLLWSIYQESPFESRAGLLIIAAGLPAYWFFNRNGTLREV